MSLRAGELPGNTPVVAKVACQRRIKPATGCVGTLRKRFDSSYPSHFKQQHKSMKELQIIQTKLKAPKNQYNSFGKYNYRSCEDIVEAAKPILAENECTLTISDDIIMIGNRIYVKATATITNSKGEKEQCAAFAREEETLKGMTAPQITGSTSSYARKYALNGLFCIDDTQDSDSDKLPQQDKEANKTQTAKQEKKITFTRNKVNDKLLQRLHDVEAEAKTKGERFSLFAFLEKVYDITSDDVKYVCACLGEYEKSHNLQPA